MTEKSDWIPIVSEPSDQFRSTLSVSPAESVRIKEVLSVSLDKATRKMTVVKHSGTWVINIPKDVDETDVLIRCVSTGAIPLFQRSDIDTGT